MDPRSLVGQIFDGKYLIESVAGMGGMGVVYRACQTELERPVALKVLHENLLADKEWQLRFAREAQALSKISHRNIGMFYSFGVYDDSIPYIAMEFVSGTSLRALLQDKKLSWQRTVVIALQLAEAMAHIHANGIMHRDLSPTNIFVIDDSGTDLVKIIDFGLSKIILPSSSEVQKLTQTGALMGSIHYMSPELCSGHCTDFRSDIYSLACIIYECLTGRVPHTADNPIGIMHKHITEKVEAPSNADGILLPPGLDEVILKALAKDPDKRYQTMSEFLEELNMVADNNGASTAAYKEIHETATRVPRFRRNLLLPILVLPALLVLAGVYFSFNTLSGLNAIADCLISGQLDSSRLANLHDYAEHYAKKNMTVEANYWAWQGLKQIPLLNLDSAIGIEDKFSHAVCELAEICTKSKTPPAMSPRQVSDLRTILAMLIQNRSVYHISEPILKLQISMLERLPPGKDLVASLAELSKTYIELEDQLEPRLALRNARRAMQIAQTLQLESGTLLELRMTLAEAFFENGSQRDAHRELAQCRKQLNETSGEEQTRRYIAAALRCRYLDESDPILDRALQHAIDDDTPENQLGRLSQLITYCKTSTLAKKLIATAAGIDANHKLNPAANEILLGICTQFTEIGSSNLGVDGLESLIRQRMNDVAGNPDQSLKWTFQLAVLKSMQDDDQEAMKIRKRALAKFARAAKDKTNLAVAWQIYANSAYGQGQKEEAIKAIEQTWKLSSKAQKIFFIDDWLNHNLQESFLPRLRELWLGIEKVPGRLTLKQELQCLRVDGRIARLSHDPKKAKACFDKILKFPTTPETKDTKQLAQDQLFRLYAENTEYAKAESLAKEMDLEAHSPGYTICLMMTDIFFQQRRFKDAIAWLAKPLHSDDKPTQLAAGDRLIYIYAAIGDKDAAAKVFLQQYELASKNNLLHHPAFRNAYKRYLEMPATEKQIQSLIPITQTILESTKKQADIENRLHWKFQVCRLLWLLRQENKAIQMQADALKTEAALVSQKPSLYADYWLQHLVHIAKTRNYPKFEAAAETAIACFPDDQTKIQMLVNALQQATAYHIDSPKASIWARSLENKTDQLKNNLALATGSYIVISEYANRRADIKLSERVLQKALGLNTDPVMKAGLRCKLAEISTSPQSAIDGFEEALKMLNGKNTELIRSIRCRLCLLTAEQGKITRSNENIKALLEMLPPDCPSDWQVNGYYVIACTYAIQKQVEKACFYTDKLLSLSSTYQHDASYYSILSRLAERFRLSGFPKESSELLAKINKLKNESP